MIATRHWLLVTLVVAGLVGIRAQEPQFEAVSIKRVAAPPQGAIASSMIQPNGRVIMRSVPLLALVTLAYDTFSFNVRNAPGWMTVEPFDVIAVPPPEANRADVPKMMRAMLIERMKLEVHWETAPNPSYSLELVSPSGPARGLVRSTLDCDAIEAAARAGIRPMPRPNGAGPCATIENSRGIQSGGITMARLAALLNGPAGRLVVDRTGLEGRWEFSLDFARNGTDPNAPLSDLPSIFTALRDQLGLKLEPFTGTRQVLVIDHAERPTEN